MSSFLPAMLTFSLHDVHTTRLLPIPADSCSTSPCSFVRCRSVYSPGPMAGREPVYAAVISDTFGSQQLFVAPLPKSHLRFKGCSPLRMILHYVAITVAGGWCPGSPIC